MSDKKDDRDYTLVKPKIKYEESTAMPESQVKNTAVLTKKERALALEDTGFKTRTRGELYKELTKNEKILEDEDYFEFPTPLERGIALAIDTIFIFILINAVIFISPLELKLVQLFFDNYKLQFMLGDQVLQQILLGGTLFWALFFGVVIPTAFFNTSVGKKMTNLRVRGDDKYTLSISQAFQREIIWKPLSVLCLVGFVLPFFDKKKKSLHDKISKTFVIKD